MAEEPNQKTKVVLQDYEGGQTLWFESAEEAAEWLTKNCMADPSTFACYELGKELTFKLVPT